MVSTGHPFYVHDICSDNGNVVKQTLLEASIAITNKLNINNLKKAIQLFDFDKYFALKVFARRKGSHSLETLAKANRVNKTFSHLLYSNSWHIKNNKVLSGERTLITHLYSFNCVSLAI